jgi:hypothetical protein
MKPLSAWAKAMSQGVSGAEIASDSADKIVKVVLANSSEIPIPEDVLRYVIKELWRAGYAII